MYQFILLFNKYLLSANTEWLCVICWRNEEKDRQASAFMESMTSSSYAPLPKSKICFVVHANLYGVNIPAMVDFKLPPWCQLAHEIPGNVTVGSYMLVKPAQYHWNWQCNEGERGSQW